ncbi:hypothetical protein [Phenylobacterium sp.]|jgi:hypothetical protein|uniref:hypothetical protein n=1 Tax=Phenylobacterium sp. TaxID=1871053 RepID=UPI002E36E0ED|nr:hypothetical protein [Phenylobacterium sp.]HEX4712886.1 hypothetical protein [Phenylobacterium sp.]
MDRRDLYIGWIPNVAGRLSFSHIGSTKFPRKCDRENTGNLLGRRLAVAQRRPLGDWLLPDWYFKLLYGYSADWVFLLVATTSADPADQIARVEGDVLIFERSEWESLHQGPQDDLFSPTEVFSHELKSWARGARQDAVSDTLPDEYLERLRAIALFVWSVGVRRTGICWIKLKSAACDIAFADDYSGVPRDPNDEDVKYISNQVFFFLKDISHKHQHHPPGSDTITEVGLVDGKRTWLIDSNYRIHRKIVEMRRSRDPKVLFRASGMLAYLGALRRAAERGGVLNLDRRHGWRSALTYNHIEIENSIKASVELGKWTQAQLNIIKTALPALALGVIALTGYEAFSVGGDIRESINSYYWTNPKQTFGVFAIISALSPFYYGILDVYDLPFILRAKRILASASITAQAVFWFVGAGFLFTVALGLLAQASLMTMSWGAFARENPRTVSWIVVGASLFFSMSSVYLLPFWTTRRDAVAAIRSRLGV